MSAVIDKQVEFTASQQVTTINGHARLPMVALFKPLRHALVCAGCGCQDGQYHNIGCKFEVCPICENTMQTCGCSHD